MACYGFLVNDLEGIDVDTRELAAWLRQREPETWWTVDGEPTLQAVVALPCQGADLAEVLVRHGHPKVRIVRPEGADHDTTDIGALAENDGGRVFLLAWVSAGQIGEPWELSEDPVARQAYEAAIAG
jgi:hypothetical protein